MHIFQADIIMIEYETLPSDLQRQYGQRAGLVHPWALIG